MDVKWTSLKKVASGAELPHGVMDAMEDYNIKI